MRFQASLLVESAIAVARNCTVENGRTVMECSKLCIPVLGTAC
jgi:hypothetical protein